MKRLLVVLALLSVAPSHAQTSSLPLYVNSSYDISRNPAEDLRAAIARARSENKRILIEVGGKWCVWCAYLDRFLAENAAARAAFAESFVIVKVNWSRENENTAFLSAYPKASGYPDFLVLDSNGAFLGHQGTDSLEKGQSYDQEKMVAFAARWRVAR